jgi:hypothetical protein
MRQPLWLLKVALVGVVVGAVPLIIYGFFNGWMMTATSDPSRDLLFLLLFVVGGTVAAVSAMLAYERYFWGS